MKASEYIRLAIAAAQDGGVRLCGVIVSESLYRNLATELGPVAGNDPLGRIEIQGLRVASSPGISEYYCIGIQGRDDDTPAAPESKYGPLGTPNTALSPLDQIRQAINATRLDAVKLQHILTTVQMLADIEGGGAAYFDKVRPSQQLVDGLVEIVFDLAGVRVPENLVPVYHKLVEFKRMMRRGVAA